MMASLDTGGAVRVQSTIPSKGVLLLTRWLTINLR